MRYMLLLRFPRGAGPQEGTPELGEEMQAWASLNQDLQEAGVFVTAAGLELDDAATTVRAPGGERVITGGPYAEPKELLFSYYVIDVPDLDAAVNWAARMPSAAYGSVEIRPLAQVEQGSEGSPG
jgi:hypothetical protein